MQGVCRKLLKNKNKKNKKMRKKGKIEKEGKKKRIYSQKFIEEGVQ